MNQGSLQTRYLIIGAGLSGLSTAHNLGSDYVLIEKSDSPGGTSGTLNYKEFKLDNGIHVLYSNNNSVIDWLQDSIKIQLLEKKRKCSVWINNSFVPFPVQYNLAGLPIGDRLSSFFSLVRPRIKKQMFENFEKYSQAAYGDYLLDKFVRPYNEKLFGVPLSQLNTDWLGNYVPKPSRFKMLISVLGIVRGDYGRNSIFYYPQDGGISTVASKLSSSLRITPTYNSSLIRINLEKRKALLNDQTEIEYKYLINTMPLDTFITIIENLPKEIAIVAKQLRKNSTTLLHILGKGKISRQEHWIYVPDSSIPFYRITIPGNINSANCPTGLFSLTLEFGGDVFKNLAILENSLSALTAMGILHHDIKELEFQWKLLNCGYVIYDEKRESSLEKVFSFLRSNKIWSIGRYGAWEYSNMEDAILHGKNIASQILNQARTCL
jgi:protoporphyrinogen oxidase